MGRIEEALRRAGREEPSEAPVAAGNPPASELFVSPWAFPAPGSDASEAAEQDTDRMTAPAVPEVRHGGHGRLALFRGFATELQGRIVAAPGAPAVLAEQYRRLAATLHHAQLVQGTKVVMVTSAHPGDGKTLTAANLALTLSESYRRDVLLVDADLRRPSLHELFGVPNMAGLNEGLKARRDDKLAVLKITETLTLLPAGRPDPDPMSSLTSNRMAEILREGAGRFDWVVVDTAPLGVLTDANLLSTMVDGALLVIRAEVTPYAAVTKAVDALGRDRLLGVVLNGVDVPAKETEYYGRYHQAPHEHTAALAHQD
jgi:protein-tyrosine kinase